MQKDNQIMHEGEFYHLYNRGNNHENIFYTEDNYLYFLKKFDYYLSEYLDVFCYCLLPNHFHILVRVKEQTSSEDRLTKFKKTSQVGDEDLPSLPDLASIKLSEQFRLLFMSYSKAINKQRGRNGSLFQKETDR